MANKGTTSRSRIVRGREKPSDSSGPKRGAGSQDAGDELEALERSAERTPQSNTETSQPASAGDPGQPARGPQPFGPGVQGGPFQPGAGFARGGAFAPGGAAGQGAGGGWLRMLMWAHWMQQLQGAGGGAGLGAGQGPGAFAQGRGAGQAAGPAWGPAAGGNAATAPWQQLQGGSPPGWRPGAGLAQWWQSQGGGAQGPGDSRGQAPQPQHQAGPQPGGWGRGQAGAGGWAPGALWAEWRDRAQGGAAGQVPERGSGRGPGGGFGGAWGGPGGAAGQNASWHAGPPGRNWPAQAGRMAGGRGWGPGGWNQGAGFAGSNWAGRQGQADDQPLRWPGAAAPTQQASVADVSREAPETQQAATDAAKPFNKADNRTARARASTRKNKGD